MKEKWTSSISLKDPEPIEPHRASLNVIVTPKHLQQ